MSNVKAFIDAHLPDAQAVAEKIGVDPMVILGQWGLETGWGKSVVPGTNNLGNIKGLGVAATDNATGSRDQYRAYQAPSQFNADFSKLIANRYPQAAGAGPDAQAYGQALQAGGYAEDPQYGKKVADAATTARTAAGIDIDPAKVKWDAQAPAQAGAAPASTGQQMVPGPSLSPQIDASKVKWDPTPALQAGTPPAASAQPQASASAQPAKSAASINVMPTPLGMAEYGLHAASGLVGQVAGGWAGLLTGGDDKAVEKVSNALTYEPRTASGKAAVEGVSQGMNMLMNAPGVKQARSAYNALTDAVGGASPAAGAALATLPTVVGMIATPEARGAVGNLVRATPGAVETAAIKAGKVLGQPAPGSSAQAAAARIEPSLAPTGASTAGRGSVGAAGTNFTSQARAEGVPEPIVQKIAVQEKAGTLNPTAANRHIEAGSLPVPVELTAGQATGDVNLLSHEQNMRGKVPELAQHFNAQNGQLAANFEALRDRVAPDVHVPAGHALDQAHVDAYKAMDAPIQEDIRAKYKDLTDANGGHLPMSGTDFTSAADQALNAQSKAYAHFLPSKVANMMAEYRDGGPMKFNDFESMRTILANEASRAAAAGDGNAVTAVNIVRNALESLPMSEETAAIKPLADAARAAAKARFDAMKSDPAYNAAVNDGVPIGEPSPVADGFFRKYVVQGKTANVQNMLQNLSNDPANRQLLSAGMIDHIKGQSGIDLRSGTGNVSQAALNKALRNLDQKTGLVLGPEAAQTLDKLGNVARYTQEQPRGSYVNNSNTFVADAANAAKSMLEGGANFAAKGIPVGTWTRNALARRALGKEVSKTLEPGAGLNKLQSALKRK